MARRKPSGQPNASRPPERGSPPPNFYAVIELAIARIVRHGPSGVVVLCFFAMLAALGGLGGAGWLSSDALLGLGAFGLVALWLYLRHTYAMQALRLTSARQEVTDQRRLSQDMRRSRRNALPARTDDQLPLPLPPRRSGGGQEQEQEGENAGP